MFVISLFKLILDNHFTTFIGIVFLLGIIAAAFSSADSALTALTTAFCIDFLNFDEKSETDKKRTRLMVHIGFSVVLFLVIVIFRVINDDSVISAVFTVAGYTYGPLLGLYTFGLFTKRKVIDKWVPFVALLSPILSYIVNLNSVNWFWGYRFGFEILILNGLLAFIGLWLISFRNGKESVSTAS